MSAIPVNQIEIIETIQQHLPDSWLYWHIFQSSTPVHHSLQLFELSVQHQHLPDYCLYWHIFQSATPVNHISALDSPFPDSDEVFTSPSGSLQRNGVSVYPSLSLAHHVSQLINLLQLLLLPDDRMIVFPEPACASARRRRFHHFSRIFSKN